MKRFLIQLALLCAMMVLTCTAAFAADGTLTPTVNADLDSSVKSSVSLQADGAEKLQVTLQNVQSDKQFIIFVLSDNTGTPTENNIVYIDQDASVSGSVGFTAYPKEIEEGKTYYIYVSSNADQDNFTSLTLIGTFVYANGEVTLTLGDVNGDGSINGLDSLQVLRHVAHMIDLSDKISVADVNGDGTINGLDSLQILRHVAHLIDLTQK